MSGFTVCLMGHTTDGFSRKINKDFVFIFFYVFKYYRDWLFFALNLCPGNQNVIKKDALGV